MEDFAHISGGGGATSGVPMDLELVEHEERARHQATEGDGMVPVQLVTKVERREHPEDRQGNDFLDHLQLVRRKVLAPMRLAGTCRQYSKNAMDQLTTITFHNGTSRYFRWPYHAKVIKIFEPINKRMVHMCVFSVREMDRQHKIRCCEMSIAENIAHLNEQITEACRRSRPPESDVALMAVSKVHPAEAILEAYAAGQRLFGENRVQEFQEKSAASQDSTGAEFHLIGPLQSNKTNKAAELFDAIDAVDSLKIAQRLNAAASARTRSCQY